jgi:hypothetical protein
MATYTNLSILQSWLEIDSLKTVTRGRTQVPVIYGWICTTDEDGVEEVFNERHPVILSDRPAQEVLDITRKLNDKSPLLHGVNLVQLPEAYNLQLQVLVRQRCPFVIAHGKLLTYEGRSCVDIQHIPFLGLPWGALDALYQCEGD